jgi:DNA gyrase subunit B
VSTYDASSITVLRGLEPVRARPAMYIGSTGDAGVHALFVEVVQNAIDEAMAGFCRDIAVILHPDGSCEVRDDGRGIPVDAHPATGRPACEVVLTTLHAGGKFGEGAYAAAGGLHGVGVSCVNALSDRLILEIWRDGAHWRETFARGEVVSGLELVAASHHRGTSVRFHPDAEIFGARWRFDEDAIRAHLQAQSWLHAGLRFSLRNADGVEDTFVSEGGLTSFVRTLNEGRELVHDEPIHLRGTFDGIDVDVAMQWTHGYAEDAHAYVNSVPTPKGGTHVEGLKAALTRAVNTIAAESALLDRSGGETIAGFDIREGLASVLSIRLRSPEFEGQTKGSLSSPAAAVAVEKVAEAQLAAHLRQHPSVAAAIVGRALEASRARAAARRASERARYQRRDFQLNKDVYRQQFGIRSKNWHQSARWLTDKGLLESHAAMTQVAPDARVLDVCCGSGVVGASFRGRVGHITGLDITPEMVALSRQRLDEVVQGDVYDIPFDADSFDLVCNREVLHLLPHPERPVAQVYRVLKPGGQFIVGQWVPYGVADAAWMFRIVKKKQPLFFNNLMEEDMRALLQNAGFTDITVTEYRQWEDIDTWIDTWETPSLNRHEIRDLYHDAPAEAKAVHPFEIDPTGRILDCWRWVVLSGIKPA